MRREFIFNQVFGKKWHERFDRRFSLVLASLLILVSFAILYVANLNYQQLNQRARQIILAKYKERIAELIITNRENKFSDIPGVYLEQQNSLQPKLNPAASTNQTRQDMRKRTSYSGIRLLPLPEPDDEIYMEDIGNPEEWLELRQPTLPSGSGSTKKTPYNHNLTTGGDLYINLTEDLIPEIEDPFGYRDPDEITQVIEEYQPMIHFCYQKVARHFTKLSGFVKVEFKISYEGYVVPGSIRILNSSLHNREIEQCLKKYIERWRNFKQLDKSMGIAKVKQKFIFN